jgi:hypothetical protein
MATQLVDPFPEWAWPMAWEWLRASADVALDDFSPRTVEAYVERISRMHPRAFGACKDGRLAGVIVFVRESPCLAQVHVATRRHTFTPTEAAALLRQGCERAFEEPSLRKISAVFLASNRAVAAGARRCGFEMEGRLRGQTVQHGRSADVLVMGLRRGRDGADIVGARTELRNRGQQLDVESDQFGNRDHRGIDHTDVLGRAGRPTGSARSDAAAVTRPGRKLSTVAGPGDE